MIKLFAFAPLKLNLNGDQANLLVLQRRLEWLGVDSQIFAIETVAELASLKAEPGEFLLLGHGSRAAMKYLGGHEAIRTEVERLAKAGMPGLAVGSGYELLRPTFVRGERVSDYARIDAQSGLPEAFGYINTDTDLPPLARLSGDFLVTMVHGPVLAKSPALADWFIEKLGVSARETEMSKTVDGYAAGSNQH